MPVAAGLKMLTWHMAGGHLLPQLLNVVTNIVLSVPHNESPSVRPDSVCVVSTVATGVPFPWR